MGTQKFIGFTNTPTATDESNDVFVVVESTERVSETRKHNRSGERSHLTVTCGWAEGLLYLLREIKGPFNK